MVIKERHAHQFFAYGGAHAFLVVVAFQIEGREGWLIVLPLMAIISFYAWFTTMRRHRMMGDTPTSHVASAAQGYVELTGRAEIHPEAKTLAQLTKKACCWFRYTVEERDRENDWRTVDQGESDASFLLRDASGACHVDPEGAEITCSHEDCWTEGDARYTEYRIEDGDPLYALGEFRTRSFAPSEQDERDDVRLLLAEWKEDKSGLLRRFDLNADALIDDKEWELARAAAKREVEKNHAELRAMPSVDFIMQPSDGRLFLLANYEAEGFQRRLAWWSWAHLVFFFAALIAMLYIFF